MAPFSWLGPEQDRCPLLLASPHSGRAYPAAFLAHSKLSIAQLRHAEDPWIDHLLAPSVRDLDLALIKANWGRSVIDLNRAPDELDPEIFDAPHMAAPKGDSAARIAAGLGVLPRIAAPGLNIYHARLPMSEATWRLEQAHKPYHAAIRARLQAQVMQFGRATLIDCHSMPSLPLISGVRADVVVGDRFGQSCDTFLTQHLTHAFTSLGLKVAHNTPYAGGHTTQYHGQRHAQMHALQIELDRALYMDVRTGQPNGNFAPLACGLKDIFASLSAWLLHSTACVIAAE